ncbi:hypothetical protein GCM10022389_26320 [Flavobacterium cheonanense]|uniref:Lipocalin-like domain-containing protein n=1 Tax=Flavobacterium cheonanense TaxID=706183 RepID=A0ABP7W2G1_9FLAO
MKTYLNTLFIFFLISIPNIAKSQNLENFEEYIVNEWSLEYYETGGAKFPPKSGHENDKMIFTKEHKSESINNGVSQVGTWEFDKENGILLVVEEKNEFKMKFKVISCTETNCVLELKNLQGQKIRAFLVAN